MRFAAAAAARNIGVSVPWGQAQKYDVITDADGVLKRVQVKLATYSPSKDRWDADVRVTRRPTRGTEVRTPSEGGYDILAVIAGSAIYLFREGDVRGRSAIVLRPPGCRAALSRGRAIGAYDNEVGLDAWRILKEVDSD